MQELIRLRSENSKTFSMEGRKRQLESHTGAVHYKEDYTSNAEGWKDIDLTWEGNRITKAPYELTVDEQKATIKNKRTGEVSIIELLDCKPAGLKMEIVPDNTRISFRHTLPSDKIPFKARFKVGGKGLVTTRAFDDDGDLELETSLVDGILTEKLSKVIDKETKKERPVKGKIKIDPIWQVGASTDDCYKRLDYGDANPLWRPTANDVRVGCAGVPTVYTYGSGMRFTNITIPQGTTIDSAYLTLTASNPMSGAAVKARISADDTDDAATFSTVGDFDTRYAARTTARVDWDNIAAWTNELEYDSPEIKTVIQEIVDRGGWTSGNDIAIFWEDFDERTSVGLQSMRFAYAYDASAAKSPKLVIIYLPLTISGTATKAGVGVENAKIYCINQSTDEVFTTLTDVNGDYSFDVFEITLYHLAGTYESEGTKYNALSLWDVEGGE